MSPDSNQLLVDFENDRAVSMGAPVRVDGIRRDRDVASFRIVNPTPDRQVVNLRFRKSGLRDYDFYLDGTRSTRLFDTDGRDRLAVITPASPVSEARAARLRKVADRLQTARETAYREGKLPLIEQRVDALQAALDSALKADGAARSVVVSLAPGGSRPKLAAQPAVEDAEQAVSRAEAALREAAALGPKEIADGAARRLLVGAVVPVEATLHIAGDVKARGTLSASLTVTNESDLPVSATVSPDLPLGWVPSSTSRVDLAPGKTVDVEFSIRLPEEVEQCRHRISARTTFSLLETSWDLPATATAGTGSIRSWSIIGPFPNTNDGGLAQAFPPEQEIVADADYNGRRWRVISSETDRVDLGGEFLPNTEVLGYAYTRVFSPVEQDAVLQLGSHDGAQVRLNGEKVFERHVHRDAAPGQDAVPVHLKQGWNALLLKVEQSSGEWGFYAEITDRAGGSLEGLRLDPVIGR